MSPQALTFCGAKKKTDASPDAFGGRLIELDELAAESFRCECEGGCDMRLLLVEDNEALSGLLQKGLNAAGFAIDAVQTVSEALAGLARTRFSAIILDLGLPDGDGYSVLEQLRSKGDSTPVLILTARTAVGDKVKG